MNGATIRKMKKKKEMEQIGGKMNDLGRLQGVHGASKLRLAVLLFCAFIFFSIFGFHLCYLLLSSSYKFDLNDTILVAILTLPPGIFFVWVFIRFFREKLSIYESGLCFFDGRMREIVKWDEIECVYEYIININGIDHYHYSIRTKDYQELKFRPLLRNNEQIGERLKFEAEKRNVSVIWGTIETNPLSAIPK